MRGVKIPALDSIPEPGIGDFQHLAGHFLALLFDREAMVHQKNPFSILEKVRRGR
jgi:hypothetical protein